MEPLEPGCGTVPGPRWIRHGLGSPPWPWQPQHTQQGSQKCLPSPQCKELKKNTAIMGCSFLCRSAMADICLLFFVVLEKKRGFGSKIAIRWLDME